MMDWHITQNDDFLSLMKNRLSEPKLIWVNQFVQIINDYINDYIDYLKINDIGCNIGHFFRGTEEIKTNVEYIGYDISQTYIDIAIENFGNFFKILDISKEMPRKCNISVVSATLEHIEDYESSLKHIFENTENMVIIRTFIGNDQLMDFHRKDNSKQSYLIRQFTIENILNIPLKLGWKYEIINDEATNSKEKQITDKLFRTQKVIIFKNEKNRI